MIAAHQLGLIREKLEYFENLHKQLRKTETPRGPRLALEAGIGHSHEAIRFWTSIS